MSGRRISNKPKWCEKANFNITYTSRKGELWTLDTDERALRGWGLRFLDRIETPRGKGTVIGKNKYLWIHLDSDRGASFWDNITSYEEFLKQGFKLLDEPPAGPTLPIIIQTLVRTIPQHFRFVPWLRPFRLQVVEEVSFEQRQHDKSFFVCSNCNNIRGGSHCKSKGDSFLDPPLVFDQESSNPSFRESSDASAYWRESPPIRREGECPICKFLFPIDQLSEHAFTCTVPEPDSSDGNLTIDPAWMEGHVIRRRVMEIHAQRGMPLSLGASAVNSIKKHADQYDRKSWMMIYDAAANLNHAYLLNLAEIYLSQLIAREELWSMSDWDDPEIQFSNPENLIFRNFTEKPFLPFEVAVSLCEQAYLRKFSKLSALLEMALLQISRVISTWKYADLHDMPNVARTCINRISTLDLEEIVSNRGYLLLLSDNKRIELKKKSFEVLETRQGNDEIEWQESEEEFDEDDESIEYVSDLEDEDGDD
eukprot:TRINITY_DN6968_c0_g1_i1.p1 TRINITY_DN6968_c0_g1~~TRINITY_DN6968_c0_g1_i1.p1  ORF type:complete len:480 (-),score=70.06 TRINITY_DN6968_c0_g1_i1:50-1489(-)